MNAPLPVDATVVSPCACDDPDVVKLAALIASGMTQRDASLLLWGPK